MEKSGNDVVTCFVKSGEDRHSATFPEALIRPRILSSCAPGGTVLDPFAGTGRALKVAVEQGRSAIGFEISSDYVDSARRVLQRGLQLSFAAGETRDGLE